MQEHTESEILKEQQCPLHCVPQAVWDQLIEHFRPRPWYRRHPILCLLLLVVLALILYVIFDSDDSDTLATSGDSLGLVSINGTISETDDQLKWIRKLEHSDEIKGVLLRVDSPGGGASASQELFHALSRLASKKPLVVSMGATAASGGLMISMAGERIYANGSTITGSIGVRMDIPQLRGLLDKVGLSQETLTTGPYKDAGSMLRPLSAEERTYLMGILEDLHQQFVHIIMERRKLPENKVRTLANGQIFTGREALTLGLVDALGGQDEAHAWLANKTGVRQEKKLVTKPKKRKWVDDITTMLRFSLNEAAKGLRELATPTFEFRQF